MKPTRSFNPGPAIESPIPSGQRRLRADDDSVTTLRLAIDLAAMQRRMIEDLEQFLASALSGRATGRPDCDRRLGI